MAMPPRERLSEASLFPRDWDVSLSVSDAFPQENASVIAPQSQKEECGSGTNGCVWGVSWYELWIEVWWLSDEMQEGMQFNGGKYRKTKEQGRFLQKFHTGMLFRHWDRQVKDGLELISRKLQEKKCSEKVAWWITIVWCCLHNYTNNTLGINNTLFNNQWWLLKQSKLSSVKISRGETTAS